MTTVDLAAIANSATGRKRWSLFRRMSGRHLLVAPALAFVLVLLVAPFCWLAALSLLDGNGQLTLANYVAIASEPTIIRVFATTFQISLAVTALCAVFGYILAFMLSAMPQRLAGICLLFVIIPFWTSILVRTYAWMVLLARRGGINSALQGMGVIEQPLALMYNWTGTIIGLTHIMLPFLVLPLYSSMRTIDSNLIRAAAGLGARPAVVFWRVFVPLSLPGLISGLCFIFVLCQGFFITPALLGGGRVQMIALLIERTAMLNADWGPASALGVTLVAMTAVILSLGWLASHGWRRRR